jgi:hypothetical protein
MYQLPIKLRLTFQTAALMAGMLAISTLLAPTAAADEWNKKTVITFSGPVEVPGKVLPAGTYVFKLLDSSANRQVVQIFDKDENQLYATVLALPDYRQNATGKTVIHFEETPAGQPDAIKSWYYPGDVYGVQFVYPHGEATSIAKRTHQKVLSMGDEMGQNITAPAKSANDAGVKAMENTPVTAVDQSGNQLDSGQAITSKPQK